jgi:IS5 family transposase
LRGQNIIRAGIEKIKSNVVNEVAIGFGEPLAKCGTCRLRGVFARLNKRACYRGTIKNQFQVLMQAFASNLKRLIKIETVSTPLIEV